MSKALVVDDSPTMQKMLRLILEDMGFDVRTVGSGEAACVELTKQEFPLLLIDWTLPGMSGLELCSHVRSKSADPAPTVVMITARSRPEDLDAILAAGASDYVQKPFDAAGLQTRVRVALANSRKQPTPGPNSEERVFDHLPDGCILVEDGRVVAANAAFRRMVGAPDTPRALAGQPASNYLTSEPRVDGDWDLHEEQLIRLDGTMVSVEMRVGIVPRPGAQRLVVTVRDNAEQRALQQQMILADRLSHVSMLTAGISHELRSPLAYLSANLESLIPEVQDPEIRSSLQDAMEGSRRIAEALRGISAFALHDRDFDSNQGPAPFEQVLRSCVRMAREEIRDVGRFAVEVPEEVGVASMEPSLLAQVCLSVLIASAKLCKRERETVSEDETVIRIVVDIDERSIRTTVLVPGQGFSPEDIAHLFDPFHPSNRLSGNPGFNLALSRNIAIQVGGQISVESVANEETRFVVEVPRAEGVAKTPLRKTLPPVEKPFRILSICDNELTGSAIERSLAPWFVTTLSPREGLLALRESNFDLILYDTDCEMRAKQFIPSAEVELDPLPPFVFLVDNALTNRNLSALANTGAPLVEKPFAINELRRAIALSFGANPSHERRDS